MRSRIGEVGSGFVFAPRAQPGAGAPPFWDGTAPAGRISAAGCAVFKDAGRSRVAAVRAASSRELYIYFTARVKLCRFWGCEAPRFKPRNVGHPRVSPARTGVATHRAKLGPPAQGQRRFLLVGKP